MSSLRIPLISALLLAVASLHLSAEPAKPSKEDIGRWVQQLGDNDFNVREDASRKLWEAGGISEPALREAVKSEDAEVSRRAGELLDKFKWGVYPGSAQSGHNGGDNALYVQKMHGFFREVSSNLAYEAYFNEQRGYYAGSLHGPAQNPRAAEAYRRSW